jgi:outer membrane lipoprotein-sorting protein
MKALAVAVVIVALLISVAGCGRLVRGAAEKAGKVAGEAIEKAGEKAAQEKAKDESSADEEDTAAEPTGKVSALGKKRASIMSYQLTIEVEGHKQKQMVKMKDGKIVRMWTETGEDGSALIYLLDKGVHYIYDANAKTAMKMPLGDDDEAPGEIGSMDTSFDMDDFEAHPENYKTETIDGVECWRVEVPYMGGQLPKVWVDKEWGLLRQTKAGDMTTKYNYTRINKISDDEFELPKGTKVQDLGEMMKDIPKGTGD